MLVVILCGSLAVALLSYAMLNRPASAAAQRLAVLGSNRRQRSERPEHFEDERPPRGEILLAKLHGLISDSHRERFERRLYAAGISMRPEIAVALWAGIALGLPLLYVLLTGDDLTDGFTGLSTLALAGVGAYLPISLLKSRTARRKKQIVRSMPDMMDLLTTCVEAGLGIDAALARVGEKAKEPLGREIRTTLRSISMGRSRRQALEALAARNNVNELTSFVTSVVQAESMGTSLGVTLRVQAEAVRVARKQRAEQAAQKAPIKIIIVLVLLVFPSMFAVILGPAVLSFIKQGGIT